MEGVLFFLYHLSSDSYTIDTSTWVSIKARNKNSKLWLSRALSTLKCSKEHFQSHTKERYNVWQWTRNVCNGCLYLCVCMLLQIRKSSRCYCKCAWGQICAAVLVGVAGWIVHSVGVGSTTSQKGGVFDAAQQAEVESGSDLLNSQQFALSKAGYKQCCVCLREKHFQAEFTVFWILLTLTLKIQLPVTSILCTRNQKYENTRCRLTTRAVWITVHTHTYTNHCTLTKKSLLTVQQRQAHKA